MPRRGEAAGRHELPPPADTTNAPSAELALASEPTRPRLRETWSVKLELGDEEIAKLYGQGMTRGAVVWKRGMLEWRPLLITPELTGLLRRTRITLPESSSPAASATPSSPRVSLPPDEPTVPRPARLPSFAAPEWSERSPIASVAPTALDLEPSVKPRRRTTELLGVGVAAFALAWMAHALLDPAKPNPVLAAVAAGSPPAAPACEPARMSTTITASTQSGSGIPTVSVADLPLASARGAVAHADGARTATRAVARSQASDSPGKEKPSRSALLDALGQVARAASSCGERGGPVRVVVTFANSGVARSIQVSGSDLPAATRSCMIGAASRARVPAFTGEPVTVSKTL